MIIYVSTSLHRDHPGLLITMMTAPLSLHNSLAITLLLEPSRAVKTAPFRAGKENGSRLELDGKRGVRKRYKILLSNDYLHRRLYLTQPMVNWL